MPGTNDFLPFAGGGSPNVITQAAYAALPALGTGFQSGTAVSAQLNKVWRQSSIMAAVMGALIANVTGQNAVDDGTTSTLLSNLMASIMRAGYVDDTGAVNAYVLTLAPAVLAYYDGMEVGMSTLNSNTITNPTINVNGLGAVTVTQPGGLALRAGQIRVSTVQLFRYNSTGPRFELQDAMSQDEVVKLGFPKIEASIGANALTLTLDPTSLQFRSATLTSGNSPVRDINSQLSLTVPSGASLGTVNSVLGRLMLLAIDNAGTVELAIVNQSGGNNLDETSLINTTAISAAATANNVIYSTTARTGVAFRVLGYVEATEVAAGTWATPPSLVQPIGGQAGGALQSLGMGQTWQVVTGSRAGGTTYYNTTGKPIVISIAVGSSVPGPSILTVGGVLAAQLQASTTSSNIGLLSAIVPPGASYILSGSYTTLGPWSELR